MLLLYFNYITTNIAGGVSDVIEDSKENFDALKMGINLKDKQKKSTYLRNALIKTGYSKLHDGQWTPRAFLEAYATFNARKYNYDDSIKGTKY